MGDGACPVEKKPKDSHARNALTGKQLASTGFYGRAGCPGLALFEAWEAASEPPTPHIRPFAYGPEKNL